MTSTSLTDRYVVAAARSLPEAQRAEFERELRERIADAIDADLDSGRDPLEAERSALTELGDPTALASVYLDRPLHLIGPRFFLTWWRLLKLLLVIVVPVSAVGVTIGKVISGAEPGDIIGTAVTVALAAVVHLGFWTTLVFAIIERTAPTTPVAEWTLDQLPTVRDDHRSHRLGDLIASVVFLTLFAAFIVWQHFGIIWVGGERQPIPVFDPALWSFWLPWLLALLALEVLFAIAVYLRGWTWLLAGANVLLNVAFVVPALWLLLTGQMIDERLLDAVGWPWSDDASRVTVIVLVVVIIGVSAWDIIEGSLKAWRNRRTVPRL